MRSRRDAGHRRYHPRAEGAHRPSPEWPTPRRAISSTIGPHERGFGQHMRGHGLIEVGTTRPGGHIEYRIEGVESEEVAMRAARRWARTAIADLAAAVHPLACARGELGRLRDPDRELHGVG